MKQNQQVIEEIGKFLRGHNDKLKYVVNVETFTYHNEAHCIIHEPGRAPYLHKEKFTPFLYLKDFKNYGINLYGGNEDAFRGNAEKFGIKIEELNTGNQLRLKNGYCIKVSSTLSYNAITNFLKAGGLDMWEQDENKENNKKHLFHTLTVDEQFFISTGIRLFKGIEEYVDVHKLIFDIETTGLKPFNSRVFLIGVRDNRGYETILKVAKEDDDYEERILIEKFFATVDTIKPAIIAGFNSEEFDFYFLLERAKILGMLKEEKLGRSTLKFLGNFKTTLSNAKRDNGQYTHTLIRKPGSTVKFGNQTEHYTATQMWGYSITDIYHAVKRTAAVNSEIKSNKLKYIAKFEDVAKPDRMYVESDFIYNFWKDNKIFIINPANNTYEKVPVEYQNDAEKLLDLQNKKERISVDEYTKLRSSILPTIDKEFITWQRSKIEKYTNKYKFIRGEKITERYLLDDLWETDKIDTLYNQSSFMLAKIVPTSYTRVSTMGNAAVWNLLMTTWSYERGLAIPIPDEKGSFSGGLARCYRKGLNLRIVKLDFASLYPMLQLTYNIFPQFDITGVMRKMLLYLSTTRNIYKNLANGKSLKAEQVELLKLIDEHVYMKYVSGDKFTDEEKNMFKVKQLPIKIINNSFFGALGSAMAFMWSDNVCASRITCSGRIHLRQMIKWFHKYEFIPLLAVTDGVNFTYPEKSKFKLDGTEIPEALPIDEIWKYVVDGKELTGVKAIVEYFNDVVMPKPFMGVDMDGIWLSSLNLSRINYANLSAGYFDEKKNKNVPEKIKLTGNTIKSKVMPEYIEEFIDKGLNLILHGNGEGFVEYYNEYLQKIYYKQIPLKKIATKKKYKISVKQYRSRGTDKNGRLKAKMAHMEAVMAERNAMVIAEYTKVFGNGTIAEGVTVSLDHMYDAVGHVLPNEPIDSYIYYVNVGTKKSHSDSAMIDDGKGGKILGAKMINTKDLEENPNMVGEYNVDKYVAAFNTKVKSILEGFEPNIRKMILISNPNNREFFSPSELELKNFPADDLEESMVLEDQELEFWNRTGLKPSDIWDGYLLPEPNALDEVDEYEARVVELNEKLIKTGDKRKVKSVNEELLDDDFVLYKNFDTHDLYHNKDNKLTLVRSNMFVRQEEKEYDFMKIGISKKAIEMKTEMAKKFKEEFKIPQEVKLSTIPNALLRLEDFIRIEKEKMKDKKEEEELLEESDDD
jgi:DNA polymerase elongation subunit (family B)